MRFRKFISIGNCSNRKPYFLKPQSIVAVSSDAGGARALLPVISLAAEHGHRVTVLFSGNSSGFLDELPATIEGDTVRDDLDLEACLNLLTEIQADVMLSACGLYNQIEHTMRTAARRLEMPIVGLLDSWHNYAERFTRGKSGYVFPDRICAIDETSRLGMVSAGFPSEKTFLTGHPDLEQTALRLRSKSATWRKEVREEINCSDADKVYIFLSDPFYFGSSKKHYTGPGAIMNDDGSPLYGYTSESILPAVAEALSGALERSGKSARLIVRPHPSEWIQPLCEFAKSSDYAGLSIEINQTGTTPEWLAAADGVFGMMTIALLHSVFLNRPTLSVQIGLCESGQSDPCVASHLGYIPLVTDVAGLERACADLLESPEDLIVANPGNSIPLEGATERVYNLIASI